MCETEATLTVYFEDPFWVGVLTRREGQALTAARIVFGAEPKDCEVYALLLARYHTLHFGGRVETQRHTPAPANPKRRQRQASRAMAQAGAGTKAQQALQLAREAGKMQSRIVRRDVRLAEEARRFDLKQAKRREKHRGH